MAVARAGTTIFQFAQPGGDALGDAAGTVQGQVGRLKGIEDETGIAPLPRRLSADQVLGKADVDHGFKATTQANGQ
jgi:hypothetical protein